MTVAPFPLKKQRTSFKDRIQHAHSTWDLWAIGITIVLGGHFTSWNAGLAAGTLGFGLAVLVVGLAYVCLACSMAEMTSMLPFAGGVYGLARCTLGFCVGFVLGMCEVLEYILYDASVNVSLGKALAAAWPALEPYQPLVWATSFGLSLTLLSLGGKLYWRFNFSLALVLLLLVLIYVCG
ncbi:hypothetical protein As57867_000918, partial [Aphanomyces stellatus]